MSIASPLAGKVMILTGAAGGQGRVAARVFLEAGARLVLTDQEEVGAALALDLGAIFLRHDVRRAEDWERVIGAAQDRFGRIDVLVNNAGVAQRDDMLSLTPERLQHCLDVNLFGALNGMQAVAPAMARSGGGAIVNIGSIAALKVMPGLTGYGVSKWALRGLSRYAAADLASHGIRVNLLLPGAVDVAMIKDPTAASGKVSFAEQVPLRRVANSEEIARAVVFLASDAASYITGAELTVDGGFSA